MDQGEHFGAADRFDVSAAFAVRFAAGNGAPVRRSHDMKPRDRPASVALVLVRTKS
ncbi:hypothetical protein [Actinacidiphila epipremni]|uniref:Uncharacterized protein n=1 Tax=Actinacidiphila epipremni TaxID=2053013 RepID=A0ABX0ZKT7_9ACTN|nr:hypothetical protein [Actinacidiphila epipremni]NJP44464.1 hypothetical protein [Actinacidiphila epipremni]